MTNNCRVQGMNITIPCHK